MAARLGATQSTTKAGLTPDTPSPLCDQAGPDPADAAHRPRTPPVAVPAGTRYSPRSPASDAVPARGADGVARHLGRGQLASRARSDMCRASCGLPARLCQPRQRARPGLQPVEFPNPQQVAPGTEVGQADLHPVVGHSARYAAVSSGHPRRADPLPGEAGSIKHDRPAERARTGVGKAPIRIWEQRQHLDARSSGWHLGVSHRPQPNSIKHATPDRRPSKEFPNCAVPAAPSRSDTAFSPADCDQGTKAVQRDHSQVW